MLGGDGPDDRLLDRRQRGGGGSSAVITVGNRATFGSQDAEEGGKEWDRERKKEALSPSRLPSPLIGWRPPPDSAHFAGFRGEGKK